MTDDDLTGWVKDERERQTREAELRRLRGRLIVTARYFELRYEGLDGPSWNADGFDSLDYGLELGLDDGTCVAMIWKTANHNEALLVYRGRLEPDQLLRGAASQWDVSEHWHQRGPTLIDSVTPVWIRSAFGPAVNASGRVVSPAGESDLCLETILLAGDGREAIVTLGDRDGAGGFVPSADNVAVFLSTTVARDAGVILPGDPRAGG